VLRRYHAWASGVSAAREGGSDVGFTHGIRSGNRLDIIRRAAERDWKAALADLERTRPQRWQRRQILEVAEPAALPATDMRHRFAGDPQAVALAHQLLARVAAKPLAIG
jgi:hypothetical protein